MHQGHGALQVIALFAAGPYLAPLNVDLHFGFGAFDKFHYFFRCGLVNALLEAYRQRENFTAV